MEKTIQWPKKKDVIERLNNESTIGIGTVGVDGLCTLFLLTSLHYSSNFINS